MVIVHTLFHGPVLAVKKNISYDFLPRQTPDLLLINS